MVLRLSWPGLFRLLPGCRRTDGNTVYEPCHTDNVKSKTSLSLSTGIEKHPVRGPKAHDEMHGFATGWARGQERLRGLEVRRLETDGVLVQDHPPQGISRAVTAWIHKAKVTDLHEAIGQDMLEESTDKFDGVELSCAQPCPSRFTIRVGIFMTFLGEV